MGKYTSGGKIKTTTVVGNAAVGFHDVDGGVNIIIDDAGHTGAYHPSGALRVNSGSGATYQDASGAVYTGRMLGPGR
jgi:hypothetical protein